MFFSLLGRFECWFLSTIWERAQSCTLLHKCTESIFEYECELISTMTIEETKKNRIGNHLNWNSMRVENLFRSWCISLLCWHFFSNVFFSMQSNGKCVIWRSILLQLLSIFDIFINLFYKATLFIPFFPFFISLYFQPSGCRNCWLRQQEQQGIVPVKLGKLMIKNRKCS